MHTDFGEVAAADRGGGRKANTQCDGEPVELRLELSVHAEARSPGVKVERRDLRRSVLLGLGLYWLAESVSEDMAVRLEKGHWWHGDVVEEATGDRTTLSVKYDDADGPGGDGSDSVEPEPDVVNVTDEHVVVWLRRPTRADV